MSNFNIEVYKIEFKSNILNNSEEDEYLEQQLSPERINHVFDKCISNLDNLNLIQYFAVDKVQNFIVFTSELVEYVVKIIDQ